MGNIKTENRAKTNRKEKGVLYFKREGADILTEDYREVATALIRGYAAAPMDHGVFPSSFNGNKVTIRGARGVLMSRRNVFTQDIVLEDGQILDWDDFDKWIKHMRISLGIYLRTGTVYHTLPQSLDDSEFSDSPPHFSVEIHEHDCFSVSRLDNFVKEY